MSGNRFIFVVGPPRSGTTWLSCMLAVNPEIFTLPETKFYQYIVNPNISKTHNNLYPRDNYGPPKYVSKVLLESSLKKLYSLKLVDSRDSIADLLYDKVSDQNLLRSELFEYIINFLKEKFHLDGSIFIENTPRHILFTDEIIDDFPEAKFIVMERDSVDTSLSSKNTYNYPFFSALEDSYYIKSICDNFYINHRERIISVVNYHVLKRNPSQVINTITSNLGLSPSTESKLLSDSKTIYHEIHKHYYLNSHQPQMLGIDVEKKMPSIFESLIDYVKFRFHYKLILKRIFLKNN